MTLPPTATVDGSGDGGTGSSLPIILIALLGIALTIGLLSPASGSVPPAEPPGVIPGTPTRSPDLGSPRPGGGVPSARPLRHARARGRRATRLVCVPTGILEPAT